MRLKICLLLLFALSESAQAISFRDYYRENEKAISEQIETGALDLMDKGLTDLIGLNEIPGLASLRRLFLANNKLVTLPENAFRGLTCLETLFLSGNNIKALPGNIFQGLTALQQLYLHKNQITEVPGNIFRDLNALKDINLSYNEIVSLSENIFQHLSELNHLELSGNRFSTLPANIFKGLSKLWTLYLSDNSKPFTLPLTVFDDLRALESLDLSYTNLANPAKLPRILRRLNSLSFIDLSGNNIKRLSARSFEGLTELDRICLANNLLTTLPIGLFNDLPNLDSIVLSGNRLTILPQTIFNDLNLEESLDLDDNLLTTLPEFIFAGLENLVELNLSGNRLTALSANVFDDLTSLHDLDISQNQLVDLSATTFNNLVRLNNLNLAGNRFTTLPPNIFASLASIGSVYLYNNPIRLSREQLHQESGLIEDAKLIFKLPEEVRIEQQLFAGIDDGDLASVAANLKTILTLKISDYGNHKIDITKIRDQQGNNLLHKVINGMFQKLQEISLNPEVRREQKANAIEKAEETYMIIFGTIIQFGGPKALEMLTTPNAGGLDVLQDAIGTLGPYNALVRMITNWPSMKELEQKKEVEAEHERRKAFMKWWFEEEPLHERPQIQPEEVAARLREAQAALGTAVPQQPRPLHKRHLEPPIVEPKRIQIEHAPIAMEEAEEIERQREAGTEANRERALRIFSLTKDQDNYPLIATQFKKLSDEYQQVISSPITTPQMKSEAERMLHELNAAWTYLTFGR